MAVYFGVKFVTKFSLFALLGVIVTVLLIIVGSIVNFGGNQTFTYCQIGNRLARKVDNCTAGHPSIVRAFCKSDDDETLCNSYYREYANVVKKRLVIPGMSSGQILFGGHKSYDGAGDALTVTGSCDDYKVDREEVGSEGWVKSDIETNYLVLLGVFFPAVTGIMAGSNRSGDLKNPSSAIPTGTIAAILSTGGIYLLLLFLYVGNIDRLVLKDKYGRSLASSGAMVASYLAWPKTGGYPSAVEIGALLSCIGAGLQSLTGAPRLLQAMAKDKLVPKMEIIAEMSSGGEPTRALFITVLIAEIGVLIGNLDKIAPLLSMFFILFYASVNASCTIMSLSQSPGWRPTFKYYHWAISLMGFVFSVGVMFGINWLLALLAWTIFGAGFILIHYFSSSREWGIGVRSLLLSFATNRLIYISRQHSPKRKEHWRPQILILVRGMVKKKECSTYVWEVEHFVKRIIKFCSQIKQGM